MTPEALAALHARCFETPRPWAAGEFADLLQSSFLLTTPDGFLLGRVVADEAELLTLAVDPDARRKGTGAQLVDAFKDRCKGDKATTAFLEVASNNDAAKALYFQAGFRAEGIRKAYYTRPDGSKLDAVIMTCPLDTL